MLAVALLSELSASGCTLRRLSGDRLQVTGTLTPALAERLRLAKPELLSVFPDPAVEIDREWARAIEAANLILMHCPSFGGSPVQWQELDGIESEFSAAKAAGDVEAARRAAAAYLAWADACFLLEQTHAWSQRTDFVSGSPRPQPSSLHDSPYPANTLCRSCWFDVRADDGLFCQRCVNAQQEYQYGIT